MVVPPSRAYDDLINGDGAEERLAVSLKRSVDSNRAFLHLLVRNLGSKSEGWFLCCPASPLAGIDGGLPQPARPFRRPFGCLNWPGDHPV